MGFGRSYKSLLKLVLPTPIILNIITMVNVTLFLGVHCTFSDTVFTAVDKIILKLFLLPPKFDHHGKGSQLFHAEKLLFYSLSAGVRLQVGSPQISLLPRRSSGLPRRALPCCADP